MIINYYISALKNYAKFEGRANRGEYWYFILVHVGISIILSLIGGLINTNIVGLLYSLATLVPAIAIGVRRMHDVNKDWWYILIPIYNLILAATEGTKGQNQYGPESQA